MRWSHKGQLAEQARAQSGLKNENVLKFGKQINLKYSNISFIILKKNLCKNQFKNKRKSKFVISFQSVLNSNWSEIWSVPMVMHNLLSGLNLMRCLQRILCGPPIAVGPDSSNFPFMLLLLGPWAMGQELTWSTHQMDIEPCQHLDLIHLSVLLFITQM